MATLLIVEDEVVLRSSMARGLAKDARLQVREAGSVEEALPLLDADPPELVISDLNLPGRPGIDLLDELGRRGLHIPVVFISAYLHAFRHRLPDHPRVEVREKPVALQELRRLVRERVAPPGTEAASPFGIADYVQLAALGRHSVALDVSGGGLVPGRVVVREGVLWSARDAQGGGEQALFRLMAREDATVALRSSLADPGPQTIHRPWMAVLLDAARWEDEQPRAPDPGESHGISPQLRAWFIDAERRDRRLAAQAQASPSEETSLESSEGPAPSEAAGRESAGPSVPPLPEVEDPAEQAFRRARDAGTEALLGRDFPQALAAFLEAQRLRPDDGGVAANVERLRARGVSPTAPLPAAQEPDRRPGSGADSVPVPGADAPAEAQTDLDQLKERGIEALLLRDYAGALEAFTAARDLGSDDPTVRANLERLAALGHRPE